MNIDILYVTYSKDLPWFEQSLKVLRRNLSGYRDLHVVCPTQDRKEVQRIVGDDGTVHPMADWPGNGYQWQQWVKLNADLVTDAELILHIDSDVFISERTDVSEFFVDGKPAWLWAYYTDVEVPWQAPTEAAVKEKAPREFMQAFPFILHRSTYELARQAIGDVHNYLYRLKGLGVFSEFNVLGHVAFRDQQELYAFMDRNRHNGTVGTAHWPKGTYKVQHFWSHSPLEEQMDVIRKMLGERVEPGIRVTNRGVWIVDGDTHIGADVEREGRLDYDRNLLPVILRKLKPGDVVVDVGAFIGDHTHAYAKATRGVDGGRVLAFEPNTLPFRCLTLNMEGHGHVECINKGLGDAAGHMGIAQDRNTGASHLVTGEGVEIVTLDSYGLGRCELIKIDAEGYELNILEGAKETIRCCKPVLVMEVNQGALARFGVHRDDLAKWISRMGYKLEYIAGDDAQSDMICIPR